MKKLANVYIIIMFLFLVILISYVLLDKSKMDDYQVYYTDNLNENSLKIYCLNEKNEIVTVEISLENDTNLYIEIFYIFNEHQNSLPVKYNSPMKGIVSLNEIKLEDEVLIIDIDKLPYECDVNTLLECIKKTYQEIGISTIIIKTNNASLFIN